MTQLKDINSREDISKLIVSFYADVRADDLIGPIFNRSIADERWPAHIDKLTDFWETVVFGREKYKGNPRVVHQKVDHGEGGTITQAHFGRWLQLWFHKMDTLFTGPRADGMKDRARVMSTGLFLGMANARANPA